MTLESQMVNRIHSVLPGSEFFMIYQLIMDEDRDIVIVRSQEQEVDSLYQCLVFFLHLDNIELIKVPAWDIVPYDRLSPSAKIQSQRFSGFYRIINSRKKKVIILSLQTLLQKIISTERLLSSVINIKIGDDIDHNQLISLLISFGYRRSEVAADFGEFSVRGGIIDIIDNISGVGIRLDFFGKQLDSIRQFDPTTQLSNAKIDEFAFFPVSEVLLDLDTKENFLENYKKINSKYFADQIYESIKSGRTFSGIENWLSLFYDDLQPISSIFGDSHYIFDGDLDVASEEFYKAIIEAYNSRVSLASKYGEEYCPIEPRSLWSDFNDFSKLIEYNKKTQLLTYNYPEGRSSNYNRVGSFIAQAKLENKTPFSLIKQYRSEIKKSVIIACKSKGILERVRANLIDEGVACVEIHKFTPQNVSSKSCVYLAILNIKCSFDTELYSFINDNDMIIERKQQVSKSTVDLEKIWEDLSIFSKDDFVIHKTHGIAKFDGISSISVMGNNHDCLKLIYEGNDILYLPVENINNLSKFKNSDDQVKLDKLGNLSWQQRKSKVKNRIRETAIELLKLAAIRKTNSAPVYCPNEELYEQFCRGFGYVETDDQLNAINAVLEDLKSAIPMDRLICGDVGFGKTEVALRAAFAVSLAQEDSAQVAVIVPTTLLARQHYHNFLKRFESLPIKVRQISRLVKATEAKLIKNDLENGGVDIVIGTHALLANDIKFKNLGLLIVDEEQHFGVKQKEKIKSLKSNCHVLTLSATPIPRTLQMSIVGLKDLSLIATPPVDRLSVKTYVLPFDNHVIREAILREYYRGGSVFFVAPRIEYLDELTELLLTLVPEVKCRVAHGKMSASDIEDIMMDFFNRKFEILLSTTIIESGIDLPFVNTIIIHRADMFGLSALYQLRGRVGRGKIRAYAYLTLPKKIIKEEARARLEVMQALDNLGAGFSIASNDMDLRGFGNLLGEEQSGQIKEVGVELYQSMLSEAIMSLSNDSEDSEDFSPSINLGIPVLIPDSYIFDVSTKLKIYRKASKLASYQEIEEFAAELIDRFGKFPQEVNNFLLTLKIKAECIKLNIEKIDVSPKGILIAFRGNIFKNPDKLLSYISKHPGIVKVRSDQKLLLLREFAKLEDRIKYLAEFFVTLDEMCQ
jgi:transcription-repair coupling factor (superfamily II helicase)